MDKCTYKQPPNKMTKKPTQKKIKSTSKSKKSLTKEQKTERQVMILVFVMVGIISAVIAAFVISPLLEQKPYFDYHGFRVYRVKLEGTNLLFYNIPEVTFSLPGLTYKKNVVLKTDPLELDEMNIEFDIDGKFFKTLPSQLWIVLKDEQITAQHLEAQLEIKKFVNNLNIPIGVPPSDLVFGCENTTIDKRIISFETDETVEKISILGDKEYPYCITIKADSNENLIKAADKLALEWLLSISS